MMQALIIRWRGASEGYERLMPKTPNRPRDLNQWAKRTVDIATGESDDNEAPKMTKADAAKVGGRKRATVLPKAKRVEIAKGAAKRRWEETT
jgi:hypothetical protein